MANLKKTGDTPGTSGHDWAEADNLEQQRKKEIDQNLDNDKVDDIQDEEMEDQANWIQIARKIRRYKAVINVKHIEGNIGQKIKTVHNAVGDLEEFMGAKLHYYGREQFIMVEFGTKEKMQEACTRIIEKDNEFKLEPIQNRGDDEIKNKTMIVRDLPLNIERALLKKVMERYAECEVTDIKTRITGPWVTAHVTFKEESAIVKLKDTWSIPYLKDLCRLAPANVTREEIEQRNTHTLKLSNLPFGITAYDLKELLTKVNAKTCFIPRTRDKYSRLRFAFITFENDEAIEKVLSGDDQFTIKGQPLQWIEKDTKTCHKCGNAAHIVKDCPEREQSFYRKQRQAQFRKVYTKYRVPNYRRLNDSFNNKRNSNSYNRYDEKQNNSNREQNKKDEISNDDNKSIHDIFVDIKNELKNLRNEMSEIKLRIDKLEGKDTSGKKSVAFKDKTFSNDDQNTDKDKGKEKTQFGPINDRGIISLYDRNRRNVSRNFEQTYNFNRKRNALHSEEYASSSTERNIFKARKQEQEKTLYGQEQEKNLFGKDNIREEMKNIKDMINNKDEKIEGLTKTVESVLLLLSEKSNK